LPTKYNSDKRKKRVLKKENSGPNCYFKKKNNVMRRIFDFEENTRGELQVSRLLDSS